MKLLPGGFAQLLPIVRWFVAAHMEHIEEAARGTLAFGTGGPSEEVAIECLLRIFEGRHEEADKETLEAYMRARTWEWWQDFPERRPLTDLVRRADHRKKEIGSEYSRRPPSHSEGFRIARQMLAGIPDKISLDSKSEYEDVSKLLSAFLSPPWANPPPKGCKATSSSPSPSLSTATPSGATTRSLIAPPRSSFAPP